MQLWWLGLMVTALALLIWSAQRSRELFVLAVKEGKTRVLRGRPPHALLRDLADVFERAQVGAAHVKVLREAGKPRLVAEGLDEFVLQRARNVLGSFPAHKLIPER
jgi:hypothetical protein